MTIFSCLVDIIPGRKRSGFESPEANFIRIVWISEGLPTQPVLRGGAAGAAPSGLRARAVQQGYSGPRSELLPLRHEQRARHRQREGDGTGFGEGNILVVAADAQILTALVRQSHSGTEDQFLEEESESGKSVMDAEPDLFCTRPAGNPNIFLKYAFIQNIIGN